jgi:predicted PurR-regulated permease PerM
LREFDLRPPSRHPALDAARTTAVALAVVGAGIIAWRSARLLALVLVALLVAIPLRRAVSRLARARVPRGLAAGIVIVATIAGAVALGFVVVRPLTTQVAQLVAAAPALLEQVRRSERVMAFGRALGGLGLVGGLLGRVPSLAETALGGAASAASEVAAGLLDALTVLVTAMLLVAARESPFEMVLDLARPDDRVRWNALGASVESVLSGYVSGLAGVIVARVVATTAFFVAIGVPFYLALASFAAVTILLPYVGALARFAVLVPLAAVSGGRGTALATALFLAGYDVIESYVLSPVIFRRAVALSPIVQFLAVVFLGYHAGAVGAMLALPIAAAVQAVVVAARARGEP